MKFTKLFTTALLSLILVTGCAFNKGIISVNGEVIPQSTYDTMYKELISSPQYMMLDESIKDPNSFLGLIVKDRIVNELIVKTILNQEIKKRGITVSKEEIQAKLDEIIQNIGGKQAYEDSLKANGVTEKRLKEDLKRELEVDKLVSEISDVNISDKDVKAYYDKNKSKFKMPERVRASHILIEADVNKIKQSIVDDDKNGELNAQQIEEKVKEKLAELKAKAKDLREQLVKNPKDFGKLAQENSADTNSAKKGGDLGFFKKGDMVKPFEVVAFKIQPNKISEIVETPYGYHIIMVTDRAKAGITPFNEIKEEIKANLIQQKKIEVLQNLFDGLKAQANIEYLDPSYNPQKIQEQVKEKVQTKKQQEEAGKNFQDLTQQQKAE